VATGMVWGTELPNLRRLIRLGHHHLAASTNSLNAGPSAPESNDVSGARPSTTLGDAQTWAGVASRLLEIASGDWEKLARICVLLLFLAIAGLAISGAAWWWLG
jgi:hypothetical protein